MNAADLKSKYPRAYQWLEENQRAYSEDTAHVAIEQLEKLTTDRDSLRAEVERLKAQWQPIATAPMDGTGFLAFVKEGWVEGMYYNEGQLHYLSDGDQPPKGRSLPTHWMPLPQPPTP